MTWLRAEWDRVMGFGLIALGALLLVLGYRGVSNSPYVAEQLSYIISGGLGGLFCLGVGATLLISADLHDEWRKLDRLEAAVRGEPVPPDDRSTAAGGDLPAVEPTAPSGAGADGGSRRRGRASGRGGADQLVMSSALAGAMAMPLRELTRKAYTLAAAGMLAAAVVLLVGWRRAATSADPKIAIEALAIAVAGMVVAACASTGGTVWLKRMCRLRQTRLMAPWTLAEITRKVSESLPPTRRRADDGRVWVATGLTRYHRADCRALIGMAARPVDRGKVSPKLAPCGLCEAE